MDLFQTLAAAESAQRSGDVQRAEQLYRLALELKPDFGEVHNNLGVAYEAQGKLEEAIACYRRALDLKPDFAEAHNNVGNVLSAEGKHEDAIVCYRRALELKPGFADAHNNLGNALNAKGDFDEAIVCYRRALELRPGYAGAHNNLGKLMHGQGKHDEAIECFRRAIELNPNYAKAHDNLGVALKEQGKLQDAVECLRLAVEIAPEYVEAQNNLAATLMEQGKWDEALAAYDRALRLNPSLADAHYAKSCLLLQRGNFEQGWVEQEWRWKIGQLSSREFCQPQWQGEVLQGLTILLHAEQGIGDTIQFVRYAAIVKSLGAKVVVECQKPLRKILATCPGIDQLVASGSSLPAFDVQSPLQSLPRWFRTTIDSIPAAVPYLSVDPNLKAEWRDKLAAVRGFRIGINWHGRGGMGSYRKRDVPLNEFSILARIPNVRLVRLQKDVEPGELDDTRQSVPLIELGDFDTDHGAFMDTAAVMANLDLVITSDTSVAHLAGALGVPVWLALPVASDWRWLLERSDSPWYPTMKLFRQTAQGDWKGVFERMAEELQALASAKAVKGE